MLLTILLPLDILKRFCNRGHNPIVLPFASRITKTFVFTIQTKPALSYVIILYRLIFLILHFL